jgi:hypothetical protein
MSQSSATKTRDKPSAASEDRRILVSRKSSHQTGTRLASSIGIHHPMPPPPCSSALEELMTPWQLSTKR